MNAILADTQYQILSDLVNNHTIERINPPGVEHRREFINKMPNLLLFRVRGAIGIATHFVLREKWQTLRFSELILIRRNYEQVCF